MEVLKCCQLLFKDDSAKKVQAIYQKNAAEFLR